MKLLELFSGTHVLSDAFRERGWETCTVDWDESVEADYHVDIGNLTVDDVIGMCGGIPDVIWASPDCTSYSIAAISHHRTNIDGWLAPRSEYAKTCDRVNENVVLLMHECLKRGTRYVFIENPRGGMRKMPFVQSFPRYTVTYCQYGDSRMKPTDLWTNHPDPQFRPPCHNGDSCHERAPRGSKTGTQGLKGAAERARIPKGLCEHIAEICER